MGASYFFWASDWNGRNGAATRVSHPTPAPYCNPSLIDGDSNQGEEERIEGRSEKRNSIEIRKPRGTGGLENAMGVVRWWISIAGRREEEVRQKRRFIPGSS